MPRPAIEPRLFGRAEAANYCGLTPNGFGDWVRRGVLPGPIPGTHRWDRKAIDAALDKASGIEANKTETALEKWKRDRHARGDERRA